LEPGLKGVVSAMSDNSRMFFGGALGFRARRLKIVTFGCPGL
jgi:hypothetical protein